MRVEKAGDLIFLTYFMVNWDKTKQEPSEIRCAECGGLMNKVEPAIDGAGNKYDGFVCHKDKRVIWAKSA